MKPAPSETIRHGTPREAERRPISHDRPSGPAVHDDLARGC
jgi:hypothetical protein